jgi:hypothetical protein
MGGSRSCRRAPTPPKEVAGLVHGHPPFRTPALLGLSTVPPPPFCAARAPPLRPRALLPSRRRCPSPLRGARAARVAPAAVCLKLHHLFQHRQRCMRLLRPPRSATGSRASLFPTRERREGARRAAAADQAAEPGRLAARGAATKDEAVKETRHRAPSRPSTTARRTRLSRASCALHRAPAGIRPGGAGSRAARLATLLSCASRRVACASTAGRT